MEILFQRPFYAVWQSQMQSAIQDVKKLGRNQFKDPSLAGVLQGIVEKYKIDIARLEGEPEGKRRNEEQRVRDYGLTRTIQTSWLDISVPFVGEAETFRIGASSRLLIQEQVNIGRNALTIRVPDDDNAETRLAQFKKHVEHNLEILLREYETAKPQLEQAVQQAANQRKAQIEAEDTRDKGRSFRVTN
jgi:hypothetical protein